MKRLPSGSREDNRPDHSPRWNTNLSVCLATCCRVVTQLEKHSRKRYVLNHLCFDHVFFARRERSCRIFFLVKKQLQTGAALPGHCKVDLTKVCWYYRKNTDVMFRKNTDSKTNALLLTVYSANIMSVCAYYNHPSKTLVRNHQSKTVRRLFFVSSDSDLDW